MNRRHFIQFAGTTAAALFFSNISFTQTGATFMSIPDEVWIQSGDEWFRCVPSNQSLWKYKDAAVSFIHSKDVLSVSVLSPTMPLNNIRLQWKHHIAANTKFLADHWERTYGDVGWLGRASQKKMPWYFIQHDDAAANGFGVKTGANTICHWVLNDKDLQLVLDTRNGGVGVQLGSRLLHAADIVVTTSKNGESLFGTTQRFCKMMCDTPLLPKQPVYGINDWYFAYGKNSFQLIMEHTNLLADLVTDTNNIPFSVIDGGWAEYSPYYPNDGGWAEDFSRPNDKFKDMHVMAESIKKAGMRPGLWTRALCGKHDEERSLLLPSIPGRDNPKNPVLDPSIEENLERVRHNISLYREWGYQLVKHDYTTYDILGKWGFEMTEDITTKGWRFKDNTKTTAEITLALYKIIREAAGDLYIIGCNTFSHLSAGLFELNRIGDDTSGMEWARTRKMGVNTMAFRLPQHNHFYAVDGDCVGVTKEVSWSKNKQWMQLLAESSAPLFISAQPDAVGAAQKQFIKECFAQAAKKQPVGEPLDWLSNQWPEHWKLNGRAVTFDWS